ncbi:HlyD family secretion protein [Pseudoalteromonas luteoviolacea]|uniref:AprE-like beta-barrel domain-containing protein n=1 Tax=Pseudoalteromonas luteoviolacea S4060-1 TaxID=1365257 RepID=A0A167J272_9GAMM|nr:HlyD family efflux transporter periplasmic adaptor subunit [Pseudoalteromonas luteoviolacea]KZN60420.1 hypothetical protein N478_07625 [Pseudoalteromonas luteoviolacea S4060-1]
MEKKLKASDLFRKEAVETNLNRLEGKVVLIKSPSYNAIIAFLVLFFTVVIFFVANSKFSNYETVKGSLISDQSILKVYPPSSAIIEKSYVEEGQAVEKGQLLFDLRADFLQIEGNASVDLEIKEVNHQIQNLIESKAQLVKKLTLQEEIISQKITNIDAKTQSLKEKRKILEERIVIVKRIFEDKKTLLHDGGISKLDIDASESDYLKLQETLLDQTNTLADLSGQRQALVNDAQSLPIEQASALIELDNNISKLQLQLLSLTRDTEYKVEALNAGIITNIIAREGERVSANYPLFSIAPNDTVLIADLYIPTRAIGFVEQGQGVRLRFEAFPTQLYGDIEGEIFEVSRMLIQPSEWPNPVGLNMPVYRARAKLHAQEIHANGKVLQLQNGLLLDADIILEEQSFLEYILSPILEIKNKMQ